jgi:phage-related protein
MMPDAPILAVVFFRTNSGREPVREWLLGLSKEDIKLVQFRWPLGMPLVRKLEPDLWEIRSRLGAGRIARVFFTVHGSQIALLHGYLKKSEKTPSDDLMLARTRRDLWQKEMQ